MKKLIAILLILSTLILSSCGLAEGIELIETNEYAKITLDGFEGTVLELNDKTQKAKVKIVMFGTETDVDADYVQLKKI